MRILLVTIEINFGIRGVTVTRQREEQLWMNLRKKKIYYYLNQKSIIKFRM